MYLLFSVQSNMQTNSKLKIRARVSSRAVRLLLSPSAHFLLPASRRGREHEPAASKMPPPVPSAAGGTAREPTRDCLGRGGGLNSSCGLQFCWTARVRGRMVGASDFFQHNTSESAAHAQGLTLRPRRALNVTRQLPGGPLGVVTQDCRGLRDSARAPIVMSSQVNAT